jgi:hypothetical protein
VILAFRVKWAQQEHKVRLVKQDSRVSKEKWVQRVLAELKV